MVYDFITCKMTAKCNQTLSCALAYDILLGRIIDLGKLNPFQPFFLWSFPKKKEEVMSQGHSGSFLSPSQFTEHFRMKPKIKEMDTEIDFDGWNTLKLHLWTTKI